jgi:pimeloyl-ACP methyl ester carboxylesterase
MTDERIQRAVSADGTEIAGRVHGQGPPLVLLHSGLDDGDSAWKALLPCLTDRFTCYLPSTRGRGHSSDNPDHSPPRLREDVTAFANSIGEPVGLVGWSLGGTLALAAAAQAAAVTAVAAYEPFVVSVMREDDLARFGAGVEQMAATASEGRLADAAHAFIRIIATDDELAAVESTDHLEHWARNVPVCLQEAQQGMTYEGPRSTDPDLLGQITAPVLLLQGQQTALATFYVDAAQHIAQHVADPHVRELPGLGHIAPILAPERIAEELISFFETVRQPA